MTDPRDADALPEEILSALQAAGSSARDDRRRQAGRVRLVNASAEARVARDRRRRRRLWVLGPVVALMAGFGGAVAASASALPDSPLYGLKRAAESVRLDVIADRGQRGLFEVQLAGERADEARAMAEKGRGDLATEAARDAQTTLDDAVADLGPGDGSAWAGQSVSQKLGDVAALLEAKGNTRAAQAVSAAATDAGNAGSPAHGGAGGAGNGDSGVNHGNGGAAGNAAGNGGGNGGDGGNGRHQGDGSAGGSSPAPHGQGGRPPATGHP